MLASGWSAAQCWVPCSPLHSLFLPTSAWTESPKLVFGKAIGEDVSVGTALLANFSTSGR